MCTSNPTTNNASHLIPTDYFSTYKFTAHGYPTELSFFQRRFPASELALFQRRQNWRKTRRQKGRENRRTETQAKKPTKTQAKRQTETQTKKQTETQAKKQTQRQTGIDIYPPPLVHREQGRLLGLLFGVSGQCAYLLEINEFHACPQSRTNTLEG